MEGNGMILEMEDDPAFLLLTTLNNLKLLLTYLLHRSIQHSSSCKAERFSASPEIPHILWNSNVHYRIHKFMPTVPILSQFNPIHLTICHFLKIYVNIILSSPPGYTRWSHSHRFLYQNRLYVSPFTFPNCVLYYCH
jgi:hypothetical protein